MDLAIIYRGTLASCNYDCWYCPFAKHQDSQEAMSADREALERFVNWLTRRQQTTSVLFTPWGEALTRRWYRDAVCTLSQLSHIERVVVQTNLSVGLGWLERANPRSVALWCSFHPSETSVEQFVTQCNKLDEFQIRHSVGAVGILETIPQLIALRTRLNPETYMWLNAYKTSPDYYQPQHVAEFESIDPLFRLNREYRSHGRHCHTGETVISVYGDGSVRRCHFVDEQLGNIYQQPLESILRPRLCTAKSCWCHIGYVHLKELGLYELFVGGVLERIPAQNNWSDAAARRDAMKAVDEFIRQEHSIGNLTIAGGPAASS